MLLDLLLPEIHLFTFAGFGLIDMAGPVTMGAALGHAAVEGRRGVVNVPPMALAPGITAIIGHRLQIETGS